LIAARLSLLLDEEGTNLVLAVTVLNVFNRFLQKMPTIRDEFGQNWVESIRYLFSTTNANVSSCIARIFGELIPWMDLVTLQELQHKCALFSAGYGKVTREILDIRQFGAATTEFLIQQGVPVEPLAKL
jgi:hypothetical protein